jgi:hypothetical protein
MESTLSIDINLEKIFSKKIKKIMLAVKILTKNRIESKLNMKK